MQNAHTPGPWKADILRGPYCNQRVLRESDNKIIAGTCGSTPEESSANARLIAAAPDLLAALTAAEDLLWQAKYEEAMRHTDHDRAHKWAHEHPHVTAIRAALAKALGK